MSLNLPSPHGLVSIDMPDVLARRVEASLPLGLHLVPTFTSDPDTLPAYVVVPTVEAINRATADAPPSARTLAAQEDAPVVPPVTEDDLQLMLDLAVGIRNTMPLAALEQARTHLARAATAHLVTPWQMYLLGVLEGLRRMVDPEWPARVDEERAAWREQQQDAARET